MILDDYQYDIIVIGAGHAGVEAALAPARMGLRTLLLTMNLDSIAMMPCNPSIGGTGKSHLVREIDALGGEMALNIDRSTLQSKMLNKSKGPAVQSIRAQADKHLYHENMKKVIEDQDNLFLKQTEVVDLIVESQVVKGVITANKVNYYATAVILATGTYLKACIHIGSNRTYTGPNGLSASNTLSDNLSKLGLPLRRFKTGTPARVNKKSIDFSKMEVQHGDTTITPFSFLNDTLSIDQLPCYLTYTNDATHQVIHFNKHLSAMYSGHIEGVGPRYCPSIEDKITRFADRERHQLFIEPEGFNTNEMYVQGMSSSLPEDVQIDFMRTIKGLENVEVMRPAYAIEYDCIDPLALKLTLETKQIDGLFCAGQFNGSSGYEEAAAQGLIAGINAALYAQNLDQIVIDRSQAYIGVLIDDLVTKGTNEPYRIMTGRCEYRLLLRQDNADERLTEIGYQIKLVDEVRYQKYKSKYEAIHDEIARLKTTKFKPNDINPLLSTVQSSPISEGQSLYELLKRSELNYEVLSPIDTNRPSHLKSIFDQCEAMIKYEGYIQRQLLEVERMKKLETKTLSGDLDYNKIEGLRLEARQKLSLVKPMNIGQASRISGVSPADISVLLIYLEQARRMQ